MSPAATPAPESCFFPACRRAGAFFCPVCQRWYCDQHARGCLKAPARTPRKGIS